MALAEQQARRARGEKHASYVDMAKWLTAWRNAPETAFLSECPVHAEQSVLKALDAAFQKFFKNTGGYPKFKKYGQHDSFSESDVNCFQIDEPNCRVRLPKLGWIRYRASRPLDGVPKIVTVSREAAGWYVSVLVERSLEESPVPEAVAIGAADRGVTNFIAFDSGRLVAPLNAHKKAMFRLRRYQRAVARKIEAAKVRAGIPKAAPFPKGFRLAKSNRLSKSMARLVKHQAKIARVRSDWLHKLSTGIADKHAAFCLEDLKTQNMTCSAAGTADCPGKNVRQKAGLNRSILDQGWAAFRVMLGYKLEHRGGELVLVPPHYTSQKCACCGFTGSGNRKGEAFRCLACGHKDHADVNAAKNILAAGHAVLSGREAGCAVVEDAVQSGRPGKRLPTEGLSQ